MTRTRITADTRRNLADDAAAAWMRNAKRTVETTTGTPARFSNVGREYVLEALRNHYSAARYEDLSNAQVDSVLDTATGRAHTLIDAAGRLERPWVLEWLRRHEAALEV